jgi:uncharacterized protein (UPF0261 family)
MENTVADKMILLIGTYDTKNGELDYMADRIRSLGGGVTTMDVSVLADPKRLKDYSKHDVALAGDQSIQAAIGSGSVHRALNMLSDGACVLSKRLASDRSSDGVFILGGTTGTDLALDVCQALPIGLPKYVVSTVSFSPVIPAKRLACDIQMRGLYGLNSGCKASLSQAVAAVWGAACAAQPPQTDRPLVGITSLGTSCLRYVKALKLTLETQVMRLRSFMQWGWGVWVSSILRRKRVFSVC